MKKQKFKPLFGRVLIEREVKDKSAGGVILPDAKRHARCEGKIIAIGPTVDENIKIGQHVIFGKHAGAWLDNTYSLAKTMNGQVGVKDNEDGTLFICQDEDILAIVEA